MLVCAILCIICTRDRGCSAHPVFPAPSDFGEGQRNAKLRAHRAARGEVVFRPTTSLRGANGSRECAPDDRLRDDMSAEAQRAKAEAIHSFLPWCDGLLRFARN